MSKVKDITIIVNTKDLRDGLREYDKALLKELSKGFKDMASSLVQKIQPKIPHNTGRAAASVRARAGQKGGAIAFGGDAAPYFPWLDFGGRVGPNKSVTRDFIASGRYVYPTIKEERDWIISETDELLETVARKAGFDTE